MELPKNYEKSKNYFATCFFGGGRYPSYVYIPHVRTCLEYLLSKIFLKFHGIVSFTFDVTAKKL